MESNRKHFIIVISILVLIAVVAAIVFPLVILPMIEKKASDYYARARSIEEKTSAYVADVLNQKYSEQSYDLGKVVNLTYHENNMSMTYLTTSKSVSMTLIVRFNTTSTFDVDETLSAFSTSDFSLLKSATVTLFSTYSQMDDELLKNDNFKNNFPGMSVKKNYVSSVDSSLDEYYFTSFIGVETNNSLTMCDHYQYRYADKVQYPSESTYQNTITKADYPITYNFIEYLRLVM